MASSTASLSRTTHTWATTSSVAGALCSPGTRRSSKPRPFGQGDSLTEEQDEELDSGALKLLKRALKAGKSFLMDDELAVLNRALDAVGGATQRILKSATDEDELELEAQETSASGENIVDLSWHPTRNMLAVAQLDGVVTLYHVESASWDARVLEHSKQVDIGSIEWGKFTGDTLAVACRTGIFLWKVPQKNKEPVLQEILKHPSNAGFTQVCWNADGSLLAAFAKGSKSVIVFDAIFSEARSCRAHTNCLRCTGRPQESIYSSSPRLRMVERRTVPACRSSNSALLYPYIFQDCPPSIDAQISSPALDFAEKELFSLDRSTSAIVGGKIQDVAWDPSGSRVAVTYRTSAIDSHQAGTAKLVAIFSVAWQPFLIFTRRFVPSCIMLKVGVTNRTNSCCIYSGLLRGPPNAGVPRKLAFASNFKTEHC
ncbi:WD40-repeat-containing domain [Phytophthora cactorum]|nr:WD40-repeat-containing domain [Phytophthora cactorum]